MRQLPWTPRSIVFPSLGSYVTLQPPASLRPSPGSHRIHPWRHFVSGERASTWLGTRRSCGRPRLPRATTALGHRRPGTVLGPCAGARDPAGRAGVTPRW